MKTINKLAVITCVLTIVLGLILTLTKCGWEQLDGIAIMLAGGVLLPYFAGE